MGYLTIRQCPFCDSFDVDVREVDIEDREGTPVEAYCEECGASGPFTYSKERNHFMVDALAVWNKRSYGT